MNVEEFQRLTRERDRLRREAERCRGAEESSLARLKAEFGCETLEDARRLVEGLESEVRTLEKEYREALARAGEECDGRLPKP